MLEKHTEEQMKKGLLTLAILQTIASQEMYGYEIMKQLEGTNFSSGEGTLYPLLSKLSKEGLLEYTWAESEAGPPRKYFKLSASGESTRKILLETQNSFTNELNKLGVKKSINKTIKRRVK